MVPEHDLPAADLTGISIPDELPAGLRRQRVGETAEIEGLVRRVRSGDREAASALIDRALPIIHVRVARALARRAPQHRRRMTRNDVEDIVQEVVIALFEKGARVLAAWDAERGLSFFNFVGFVAEREVSSILRSGKRSPWVEDPTSSGTLASVRESDAPPAPAADERLGDVQIYVKLLERLREVLTPRDVWIFEMLVIEEKPIDEVAKATGLAPGNLYVKKSRLLGRARALFQELMEGAR